MNRNFILEQSRRDNTHAVQLTPPKRSAVWGILTLLLLLATLSLSAQSYSPCYTNNIAKGDAAFKQGRYSEAKTYYATAKKCNGGNPSAAQQKINSCDAKIKAQKDAAEAKRKAEEERIAEEKRQAEEKRMLALCPRTMTDYDGNVYNTVYIGAQCWMRENLRTSHYANGESIILDNRSTWQYAYHYYPGGDASTVRKYGYLYNWPAVMHGSSSSSRNPSGVQGVCPYGWHVPSFSEWEQLIDYVGGQMNNRCNGSKYNIAKALAATNGWGDRESCGPGALSSTNTCAVSNNPTANNASGFSALPSGYLYMDSQFTFGNGAFFWSTTETSGSSAHSVYLRYDEAIVNTGDRYDNKHGAFSVRCIKN